jgi:hypothetical protein
VHSGPGSNIVFHDAAPGRLGGIMRCGASPSNGLTMCGFADAGAYGDIVLINNPDPNTSLARDIRNAIEHH